MENKKSNIENFICDHQWAYSPCVKLSDPPIFERICKICFEEESHRGVDARNDEYEKALQMKRKKDGL
jgi:hypothetical protein